MELGKKLVSNTIYLFLNWFTLALFSFIFWFVLGKILNPSEYGIVVTSTNFVLLIFSFSTLGITSALTKLVPEVAKRKGIKSVYSLVKTSMKPAIIFLFLLSLILFIFSYSLSVYLKIPNNVMLISIFSILAISMFNFFGTVLYGLQNMRRYFLTNFFQIFFQLVASIILILLGFRYFGPLVAFFLGYFLTCLLRVDLNYFKGSKSQFSYAKIFYYALPALIASITGYLMISGQYIILTILKNTEVTGIFAVASILSSVIGVLGNVLNSAAFPVVSELSINHKTKSKQSYLIGLVIRYNLFLTIPLSILLILFSRYAVLLFSSSQYLSATTYFPILIPATVLSSVGGIFYSNIYAIGKPKLIRNIMTITASLFLLFSIFLTIYFSALGLSFAQLIASFLIFSLSFIYIRKYLKIKFFVNDFFKVLFSSLIVALLLLIFKPFVYNIFMLVLILIPIGLLYLTILLFTNFYRIEDVRILEYLGEKIPILGKYFLIIIDFIRNRIG